MTLSALSALEIRTRGFRQMCRDSSIQICARKPRGAPPGEDTAICAASPDKPLREGTRRSYED
jgi:hypothetical protein